MVQVPKPMKLTTPLEMAHTEELDESIEMSTGLPEAPPVAIGVYVAPPTVALLGAFEVKVMLWAQPGHRDRVRRRDLRCVVTSGLSGVLGRVADRRVGQLRRFVDGGSDVPGAIPPAGGV